MFTIKIAKHMDDVATLAYEPFREMLLRNPKSVLGLATGSSPLGLYKLMAQDFKDSHLSYRNVTTYNLDEYVGLQPDHPQSYHTFMHENLFQYLDLKPENIHVPNGSASDLEDECERYEAALSMTHLDIQLLGVGSNGHIGFNEPGTDFASLTHIVDLKAQTRLDNARFFETLDEVPTQAITMGIASIMRSAHIVLIATSVKKAQAIHDMVNGPVTTKVPCSVLQNHPDVLLVLDEASASLL